MTFAVIKSFEEIKRCQDGKLLTTDQTHGWGSRSGSPRTVWRWIHTHTPGKGWWETADSAIQPAEITRLFLHLHPRSWSGWSRAESRRYRLSICGEAPSYSVRMTVCLLPIIHKSVRWIGSTGGSSHHHHRLHPADKQLGSAPTGEQNARPACGVQFQNESFKTVHCNDSVEPTRIRLLQIWAPKAPPSARAWSRL